MAPIRPQHRALAGVIKIRHTARKTESSVFAGDRLAPRRGIQCAVELTGSSSKCVKRFAANILVTVLARKSLDSVTAASEGKRMAEAPEKDPRVYFAAERTFLAWIRTGLGLMGVGFAVARFGLFLRQLRASEAHMPVHGTGLSVGSGVAIVLLGVVVLISAVLQHLTLVRELTTGTWRAGRVSRSAVALAGLLALVGIGMAVYLLVLR